jgi:ATP-dependent helicase/nuclease subunit A
VFGCGDDDLWRWKQAGGAFTIFSSVDELANGPVGIALAYLRDLHFRARWLTPSELLGTLIADRRMLEVAAGQPTYRDSWRRLRFAVDQARAWSEFSHGGRRAYLAWATRQGQDTARVAEAVLPETDTDAVRTMTIHAAKGLEFPIVIMPGLTSRPRSANGVRLLWTDDSYEVALSSSVQTGAFADAAPIDEQMGQLEMRRLLYVAATRARDHLVVSLHRKAGASTGSGAEQLTGAGGVTEASTRFEGWSARPRTATPPVWDPPQEWDAWLASLTAIRERAARPSSESASGLEGTEPEVVLEDRNPGLAKGARDLELPPWSKSRYGSAIGRAVHGVLQVIDLATADGLDDAVAAQCVAEGVLGQEELVRDLVQSALDSEVVRTAAASERWRETYVGCPMNDGTVLEGYIYLIYRVSSGRLVIVDYKTDAIPAGAMLMAKYPTYESLLPITTHNRTSARKTAPYKADAVLRHAQHLAAHKINTLADARALLADADRLATVDSALRTIPGEGAGVRRGYFWMSVGDDQTVKPDRMVLGYLARYGVRATAWEARTVLKELAEDLSSPSRPVTPWMLDHAIWSAERGNRQARK